MVGECVHCRKSGRLDRAGWCDRCALLFSLYGDVQALATILAFRAVMKAILDRE